MKFSILIAHFNNGEYFKACYESIINQTYTNWEAIILDDASQPEEIELVKKTIGTDKRFSFYKNDKNEGVGFTKKQLIEYATGDICCFVDPDDALINNALEIIRNTYSAKGCIATYSQFHNCDENLKITGLFPYTRKIKNGNSHFLNIRFEVAHLFTFKKEVYEQTDKMDASLTSSVDQDLYLKLYEKGNFEYIKVPLYLYRHHKSGVSQDPNKKKKLYKNWHIVLLNTLKRRNIEYVYGTKISSIENIPEFLYNKESSILHKIKRKFNEIWS